MGTFISLCRFFVIRTDVHLPFLLALRASLVWNWFFYDCSKGFVLPTYRSLSRTSSKTSTTRHDPSLVAGEGTVPSRDGDAVGGLHLCPKLGHICLNVRPRSGEPVRWFNSSDPGVWKRLACCPKLGRWEWNRSTTRWLTRCRRTGEAPTGQKVHAPD